MLWKIKSKLDNETIYLNDYKNITFQSMFRALKTFLALMPLHPPLVGCMNTFVLEREECRPRAQ